jgi:TonB family protein
MHKDRGAAWRRAMRKKQWAPVLAAAPTADELSTDPLEGSSSLPAAELAVWAPILVCAAIGAHVVFMAVIWGAGSFLGGGVGGAGSRSERIEVAVLEYEPVPDLQPLEPESGDESGQLAEPEPASGAPAEPEPERTVEPAPRPELEPAAPSDPAPEPSEPEATPPEPPSGPPQRITGLDIGSTVAGGSGPSFATGTSLRGTTERVARGEQPAPRAERVEGDAPSDQPRSNRRATRIPQQGVELVHPRRLSPIEPTYPSRLKAQGIEGNVLVEVRLDASGRVVEARIVEGSPHEDMNREALRAAQSERFAPATRDGQPIEFTLTYTVRFRLSET